MSEITQNNNVDNQQNESGDKIEKQFNAVVSKLTAIVNGEDNLKPQTRLPQSETASIVQELFKEQHDALRVKVKTDLKELLVKFVLMDKEFKQKEREFGELKKNKKKEFIDGANKCFNQIEGIDILTKEYEAALNVALPQQ